MTCGSFRFLAGWKIVETITFVITILVTLDSASWNMEEQQNKEWDAMDDQEFLELFRQSVNLLREQTVQQLLEDNAVYE